MSKASKHRYVVCVQNRNQTWGQATAAHQTAFLIGKISSVTKSNEKDASDRAIIKISEYAELNVPNSWDGNRNPVAYNKLSDYGIHTRDDLIDLNWGRLGVNVNFGDIDPDEMPGDNYEAAAIEGSISPVHEMPISLSIDEAKHGLAVRFGVSVEQIEIIIRG